MATTPLPTDRPPFPVDGMTEAERAIVISSMQILVIRVFFADMIDESTNDPQGLAYIIGHIKNMDNCLKINERAIGRKRMDLLRQQCKQVMVRQSPK